MPSIYLDHSATTPLDPEVLQAMIPVFEEVHGNASSVHSFGRKAKDLLEQSRESIASALGVAHDELYFTSGGTESDNAAVLGGFQSGREKGKPELLVSAIEHHAVLEPAERAVRDGGIRKRIPVDKNGVLDLNALRLALSASTAVVSVMSANNETGVIQPISDAARLALNAPTLFHTDAVQSFGKIPLDLEACPAQLVTITAHKLYGPKGIGAMVIRKGTKISPLIVGGAQERNSRAGTQNVPLAVGFARAVTLAMQRRDEDHKHLKDLRDTLESDLRKRFPGMLVNGEGAERLPHILSVSFPWDQFHLDGDTLIMGLDLRGIAVTSGSACTSGSLIASHVLKAMGLDEKTARATVRFSFGRGNTPEDVDLAADALEEVVQTASRQTSH